MDLQSDGAPESIALSRGSHQFFTQVFWHLGNLGYRGLRRGYPDVAGLELHWPFDARNPHPTPLVIAVSPVVLPRPDDWPEAGIHLPGYLFLDAPAAYEPPRALADFLAGGEPPVCISFGSMLNRDAARIQAVALAALKRTGQRGILVRSWGPARRPQGAIADPRGIGVGGPCVSSAPDLLCIDEAPFDRLLPHCRALVQHGGAGTTAAALRAGVPSVVVPHAADQAFWGGRIAALGAGPRPIPIRRLTVERLAAALEQACSPGMQECAQDVGRRIAAEDGVGACVRIAEEAAAQADRGTANRAQIPKQ